MPAAIHLEQGYGAASASITGPFRNITVPRQIALMLLSRHASVDLSEVFALNNIFDWFCVRAEMKHNCAAQK